MKVYMFGCRHNSLYAHQQLKEGLQDCLDQGVEPEFVAVEYKKSMKEQILRQRDFECLEESRKNFLREKIGDEYHHITPSIGYDMDSHQEYYPDVETVWLDDDRELDELEKDAPNHFLYNTIVNVLNFKDKNRLNFDGEFWKRYMAEEKKTVCQPAYNTERDQMWLQTLIPYLLLEEDQSCIIIVGADHISKHEGVLKELLEEAGHVVVLRDCTC
ncbi:hypothetical protein [Desulfobaculum bizertense]|uniref:Haem-binding uptake, Tiki superfamily, ChaN n=1 Tax=Desulfobaculum bizertense DSM 18034 TaxID=1121442 RepID=A0A1T4WWP8_9BACT|nr:hypothetical protein [Desulfobaculum bizertense]SKA81724.1 hypothetical protein SAMN02745702_02748 [Desulfobaculum bizertense DSM 18034]